MEELLKQLVDQLKHLDAKASYETGPMSWYGTLTLQGCTYDCERQRKYGARTRDFYHIAGAKFSLRADNKFDIPRAISEIINQLPAKLKEKADLDEMREQIKTFKDLVRHYAAEQAEQARIGQWSSVKSDSEVSASLCRSIADAKESNTRLLIVGDTMRIRAILDRLMEVGLLPQ